MWQTIAGLCGGLVVLGAFLIFKMKERKEGYQSENVFFKIVISSFQLNGLALSFAFEWDSLMTEYLYVFPYSV